MSTAYPIPASNLRIGFVSTRFSTTDGVSLESEKWAHVLKGLDHDCFYYSGLSDRPADISHVVPEAHFEHPAILETYNMAFSNRVRPRQLTQRIHELAQHLKENLYQFVNKYDIHMLLVENALAIPLNIPLGVALTEFIAETGIHTIAHHHDLFWERRRFLVNCVWDYLDVSFPPRLPSIRHVVINSPASTQLGYRRGISARLIPNVMDFDHPPSAPDDYASSLRLDLNLQPGEYFFLQPTRVVRRKGIEHAIELVRRLQMPARLVISHASGDEGDSYEKYIRSFSSLLDVQTIFVSDIIGDRRGLTPDGRKIYSLWDVYPYADLVTYPSLIEGFGNAFLEAVYFRRPILVNDYTIYSIDIKPKGFRAIEFDGFITDATIEQVREVLHHPEMVQEMANHNYELAQRFYSFTFLEHQLQALLQSFTGEDVRA
ncbi:MAG TPA: glycosyltransferase family 4 protein [Anaerolineales bacterium]|nr:glycosyltransferase family 4 protein [Anaerolineales bacterium]